MFDLDTITLRRRLFAVLAIVLVAGACAGGSNDSAATGDGSSFAYDDAPSSEGAVDDGNAVAEIGSDASVAPSVPASRDDVAPTGGGAGDAGNEVDTDAPVPTDFGRSIVFTATTVVEVDDVSTAASQAKSAIARLGGIVFGEQTQIGDVDRTTLEFRVRPEDFQDALARLGGLGHLESQDITADDVTERVVDLQSRISTSEVSVARLRDLLSRATVLDDIARLENELLQRETALETLRGQLRTIQDQVDLATIWLTLHEPVAPVPEPRIEYAVAFTDGDESGDNCASAFESLEIDEGEPFTVCVSITNVGNARLGDIEIRDDGLDLRSRDFTLADAGSTFVLEPGATVVGWAVLDAPAAGYSSVQVAAVAFDEDGNSVRIGAETERIDRASVTFVRDSSDPTPRDAISASWNTLVTIAYGLLLALAAIVPFLWVPLVAVWAFRRWRPTPAIAEPAAE